MTCVTSTVIYITRQYLKTPLFHTTYNKQITICQAFRAKQGTDYLGVDKATDGVCLEIRLCGIRYKAFDWLLH